MKELTVFVPANIHDDDARPLMLNDEVYILRPNIITEEGMVGIIKDYVTFAPDEYVGDDYGKLENECTLKLTKAIIQYLIRREDK